MDNGGLRLPSFNLTWGKVAGLLATLITAVIAATATVLTITHGIEGSLERITDLASLVSEDTRAVKEAGTRNEERVRQLQASVDDVRAQLAEHRRADESDRSIHRPRADSRNQSRSASDRD